MPSVIDQVDTPQSIEARLGSHFRGDSPPEPDPEPVEAVDTEVVDQAEDQAAPEETQEESPEVEESFVELDGQKLTKEQLKAELGKAQDYTRKTQTLADEKRLFETQQRTIYEQHQFQQSAKEEISRFQQIEAQLEQYRGVDLSQIDAETLSRMSIAAGNLREERARLKESIDAKHAQFQTTLHKSWDEMASKAREVIVKSVPDWEKVAPKIAQYALNEGFQYEHITGHDRQTGARVGPGVVDPTFARTLYKAMQWDQLQAGKATSLEKAAKAPPVVRPGVNTGTQAAQTQKALVQRHKQKGTVDTAAVLLKKYFKD